MLVFRNNLLDFSGDIGFVKVEKKHLVSIGDPRRWGINIRYQPFPSITMTLPRGSRGQTGPFSAI